MKIFTISAIIQVMLLVGCRNGMPSEDSELAPHVVRRSHIVLVSEINEAVAECVLGPIPLVNRESGPANVSLVSKSCACLEIDGLPSVLGGKESVPLSLRVAIGRERSVKTYAFAVRLSWMDGRSQQILIQQEVMVVPDVSIEPSAFTFAIADMEVMNNTYPKVTDKKYSVASHYRSKFKQPMRLPAFAGIPAFMAISEPKETYHRQISEDIWEVRWQGTISADLKMHSRNGLDVKRADANWMSCSLQLPASGAESVQFPVTVRFVRSGISVHPEAVFIDKSTPKVVTVASADRRHFRLNVTNDVAELPFVVKVVDLDASIHSVEIIPKPDKWQSGTYPYELTLSGGDDSGKLRFEVVVMEDLEKHTGQ